MTGRALVAGLAMAMGTASAAGRAAPAPAVADVVFLNGDFITLDEAGPRAAAVAARDGRIVAVGAEADVLRLAGPATQRVSLAGGVAVPGLADAHLHVENMGASLENLDLVGAASLAEALRRIEERARTLSPGEWLLGRGWDQNDWAEKRFPTAADLDRASPDRPVFLTRVDGHAGWANTRALALAGIEAATPDPASGRILRDAQGKPTGVLVDAAQSLVRTKIPPPSREVRKRRLAAGLRVSAEAGLTSVHDAGVDLEAVALYKELLAAGALPVRVYVMLRPADFLAHPELKPEVGLGDGRLTVRAIKVVADGALGSRGALLLEPYSDEPGTRGLLTVDPATFKAVLAAARARGFQVNTHAIGDGANGFVLDAYQEAFGGGAGAGHRFRVEHAQVVAPADVPRFKALGVIPSVQPTHCTSDMYWAEDRLGPERAKGAYLWRAFLDQGLPLPAGSDAPVEAVSVVAGLYAAVTRQDAKGWPEGGWRPAERVSALEALRMFSAHAAFAAFEEDQRGALTPGRRADITVLSRDPTAGPPRALLDTAVTHTVVGGQVVYARGR